MSDENEKTEQSTAMTAPKGEGVAQAEPGSIAPAAPPPVPLPPGPMATSNYSFHQEHGRVNLVGVTESEVATGFAHRRNAGIACGIGGILVVTAAVVWAEYSISKAIDLAKDIALDRLKDGFFVALFLTILTVQAIVSVAGVYFGYSMLRVAERLFVPRHLLLDAKDVEVVRAILGIDTPAKAATDQLKNMADQMGALAKLLGEITKPVVEAVKNVVGADKK